MPLYMFRKKDKTSWLEEVQIGEVQAIQLAEPASASLQGDHLGIRFLCTACEPPKLFAKVGALAMHFKKSHKDLYVDKNSFRQYMEKKEIVAVA